MGESSIDRTGGNHAPDSDALASFFERATGPTVVTGPDQRIQAANRSAASLFGYSSSELVGRPLRDLVPAIAGPAEDATSTTAPAPVLARHRDGSSLRLRVSFRPVPVEERLLTAACFQQQDAPARGAEQPTLDRLPVPVLRFDGTGRVLYANHRASVLTGRPRVDTIGRRVRDFPMSSHMARTLSAVIEETIRTGEEGRTEFAVGFGHESWFEARVVAEGAPGAPGTTALLTASDITTHHQAASQLEMSELRFRRLAEGSQDLISQHSRNGRFVYASPAASLLLGREADELIGRSLDEVVHPDDRAAVRAALQAALSGELARPVAFRASRADGEQVSCELTAHASDASETGEAFVICITRNISERVRGEEILRAASRMEATATLAAGVAHDFNNLMTGILGNAELLLTDPTFPDAASRLDQVAEAAKRGGALAQQLLAYARGGKYRTTAVSLNEVVHQTLHLQRHALPPRIRLEEDLAPTVVAIEADPVQIGQVVTNLCINAAEAIDGIGEVTVRTRSVELDAAQARKLPGLAPGAHVLLEVRDSGRGIDPEVLPHIFEPFFSTKFQGRGLGLAAAYGIVKNHGGHIGVESKPGAGTVFSICLPATTRAATPAAPVRQSFPTGDETILLVDDDEAVVDVTRAILERLNYRVLVARHGIEAIEMARAYDGPIHLALLDMGMPLAGGAEAFPFLREARPDMRILISSGYEMNEVVEDLLKNGADAFLQKPYRISGLARGLRQVLDGTAARKRLDD